MMYKRAVIECPEEKAKRDWWESNCAMRGIDPGKPDRIVSWHGQEVAVLGVASKAGEYEYAAIRFDGQKYHEIIKPKYLRMVE